jgi:hypothetical protein
MRPRRWWRFAILAAALGAFASGCAGVGPAAPPVLGNVPADQVETLVRRWEADWQRFVGLRGAVDLTLVRKGQTQRGAGALLLSPTHMRFEAITPIGFPAFIVTVSPERLLIWSPAEGKAWTGRPTAAALARWLGLPVEPPTLIRLLAGYVPTPGEGIPVRVAEDRGPHVVFERGGLRQQVWVDPAGQPARVQLANGQRLVATFERTLGGPLQTLVVEAPGQSAEVRLRYISGEYLTPPPDAFELRLPADVVIESLD